MALSVITDLQKRAEAGNTQAMRHLSMLHLEGKGVDSDLSQFFYWIKKAAESGDRDAMPILSWAYREGVGTTQDQWQFFIWIAEAAEKGEPNAMFNLSLAHRKGIGVKRNIGQYFTWLKKSAEAGNRLAMLQLAIAYRDGIGAKKNPDLFFDWIHDAAVAGDLDASVLLANAYYKGIGRTAPDPGKYFQWLRKAADAGDRGAMVLLALAYRVGEGVRSDLSQFRKWMARARDAGHILGLVALELDSLQESEVFDSSTYRSLFQEFRDLHHTVQEIKRSHLVSRDESATASYYVNLDMLHGMIGRSIEGQGSGIALFNVAYIDDEAEGQRLLKVDNDNARLLGSFVPEKEKFGQQHTISCNRCRYHTYIARLSLQSDHPDIWDSFGNGGDGFSIVTSIDVFDRRSNDEGTTLILRGRRSGFVDPEAVCFIKEDNQIERHDVRKFPSATLYKVKYSDEETNETLNKLAPHLIKIRKFQDKLFNQAQKEQLSGIVRVIINDLLYFYRDEAYSSDEEARIAVTVDISDNRLVMDDSAIPKLFIETKPFIFHRAGTKVIIGPNVPEKAAAEINLFYRMEKKGLLRTCDVVHSSLQSRKQ